MTTGWRNILITVVLAALAAGAAGWVGAQYVISHPRPAPSLHDLVHRDLQLTPEQSRQLDHIEERFAVERARLEADIRAANRELAAAIREGEPESPRVEAAIEHLHHAMGELQKATIAHVFAMRAVLNEDQARRFDAAVMSALTDEER